jgi:hypothetical protein
MVDNKRMASAGPKPGVGLQEIAGYQNRQVKINSKFRGNEKVINSAMAVAKVPMTYGFLPNQKVCSTTCGSAISRGSGQWWTGIGPNSQYRTVRSYGE